MGISYGECIDNSMKETVIDMYGCLPPWFPNSGESKCYPNKGIQLPDQNKMNRVGNDFVNFAYELDQKLFKTCLPPCVTIRLDFIETGIATYKDYIKICISYLNVNDVRFLNYA